MKKSDGNGYFKFALAVAAASMDEICCDRREDAVAYVHQVLKAALENTGLFVSVCPLAYPESSKKPMRILINGEETGLLWYYPGMSNEMLVSELADLLSERVCSLAKVPA